MIAARQSNMTRDTIERAIKRASGADGDADYLEMRYEGYGPGGVALIVEALTDNRNRTASDVRSTFAKFGGNMGEANSVSFMFERVGQVRYALVVGDADKIMEAGIEAGADDVQTIGGEDGHHEIVCAQDDFIAVRDRLEKALGAPSAAKIVWRPKTGAPVEGDAATSLFKLIDALEDNDDVQTVYANFEVSDETLAKLAG